MSKLTIQLPDKLVQRLQDEAERQQVSVSELVQAILEQYLDDEDEPTKEEILADLRETFRQIFAGEEGRPIDEVLDEIRQELAEPNANHR
jgi:plasmid stability protein